jgi:hypothetical protein
MKVRQAHGKDTDGVLNHAQKTIGKSIARKEAQEGELYCNIQQI